MRRGQDVGNSRLMHQLYRVARIESAWALEEFAESVDASPSEVEESLERLERLGLLLPSPKSPSGYRAADPEAALSRLFAAEVAQSAHYEQQVAGTRQSIAALMQEFSYLLDSTRDEVQIEPLRGSAQVNAFLDDAISRISSRECVMHPGGIPPVELVDDMLLRDKEVMSRGIQIKALYMQYVADVEYMRDYLVDAVREGAEVRVTQGLPLRLMIFDENLALTSIDPKDSSAGAIAIHSQEMVTSFQAMFDFCWLTAQPIESVDSLQNQSLVSLSPQQGAIALMLAEGLKDQIIARKLGISVRTLSRLTASLLEQLNVETRFQAGMKIAQLNLLSTLKSAAVSRSGTGC